MRARMGALRVYGAARADQRTADPAGRGDPAAARGHTVTPCAWPSTLRSHPRMGWVNYPACRITRSTRWCSAMMRSASGYCWPFGVKVDWKPA